MEIWQSCIATYLLAIWHYVIAKCMLAIWWHPIAKHTLSILATPYCLNRNNRGSSFYWARGSELCYLTCFSYFSCYFLILVFSQKCYILISLRLSWLHGNPISCPVFLYLWHSKLVRCTCTPYFWHRTSGFLEATHLGEPGSRLITGDLSPFCLLPKVSGENVC